MKISGSLSENIKYLQDNLKTADLKIEYISLKGKKVAIIYVETVTDKELICKEVITPIKTLALNPSLIAIKQAVTSADVNSYTDFEKTFEDIFTGKPLIIIDGVKTALTFNAKKVVSRAVDEPPTSAVIKGPRVGFTENLNDDLCLIRQKLKNDAVKFVFQKAGKYSQTLISIIYIDGITPKKLVDEVKEKISQINIDAILDSSYVARYLTKRKASLFKQYGTTEKPDILCAKLLEGRVAVMVEGSPIAITLPYIMLEDFQSPADYYTLNYRAVVSRLLRLVSVGLAITLPAFFVAAEMFHLQLLPLKFLLTIISSIRGIPLSPSFEMFFTLLIFEILDEVSVRMPKQVGMVISIVGGLVLGETAVNAGIISAPTLMIVALSGICLFTAPELQETFSIIRFIYLIVAGAMGGYAVLVLTVGLLLYLVDFENFKTPILAPYTPLVESDLKDGFIKSFNMQMTKRPETFRSRNKTRLVIKDKNER